MRLGEEVFVNPAKDVLSAVLFASKANGADEADKPPKSDLSNAGRLKSLGKTPFSEVLSHSARSRP
jgi:hypothetical protein